MVEQKIRFDDGAAYEQMMGIWSRFAGEIFLDWLAPLPGLRWIDVGCGNGAFTELLVERCAPVEVQGIDPSEGQLAFARTRPASRVAEFRQGDAMALPFPADRFDAAVMALVLVFVPDPAKGIAEMVRVVSPGGTVATYMWDMLGGGISTRSDPRRDARDGPCAPAPAADGSVPNGSAARLVDGCRSRGCGDAGDHSAPDLRGFRRLLDDPAQVPLGRPRRRRDGIRRRRDAQESGARGLPADTEGRITYGARAHAIKGLLPK